MKNRRRIIRRRRLKFSEKAVISVVAVILICAIAQGNLKKGVDAAQDADKDVTSYTAFFSDSLVAGGSLAGVMGQYADGESAGVYAQDGLDVEGALDARLAVDGTGTGYTLAEYAESRSCGNIYLAFGQEELGWYREVYIRTYKELLDELTRVRPDAHIYVLSILPVTAERSAEDSVYNNPNIDTLNALVEEMCQGYASVTYLDITDSVAQDGILPDEAAVDGINLRPEYGAQLLDYIESITE